MLKVDERDGWPVLTKRECLELVAKHGGFVPWAVWEVTNLQYKLKNDAKIMQWLFGEYPHQTANAIAGILESDLRTVQTVYRRQVRAQTHQGRISTEVSERFEFFAREEKELRELKETTLASLAQKEIELKSPPTLIQQDLRDYIHREFNAPDQHRRLPKKWIHGSLPPWLWTRKTQRTEGASPLKLCTGCAACNPQSRPSPEDKETVPRSKGKTAARKGENGKRDSQSRESTPTPHSATSSSPDRSEEPRRPSPSLQTQARVPVSGRTSPWARWGLASLVRGSQVSGRIVGQEVTIFSPPTPTPSRGRRRSRR